MNTEPVAVKPNNTQLVARIITGLLFVFAGIVHFVRPEFYEEVMPPMLPGPRQLIYISGFFEILGGVGLWSSRFKRPAAWGLIALLVAVYPANIYHAIKREEFPGFLGSAAYHIIRLPLQAVMVWWVWRFTRRD